MPRPRRGRGVALPFTQVGLTAVVFVALASHIAYSYAFVLSVRWANTNGAQAFAGLKLKLSGR